MAARNPYNGDANVSPVKGHGFRIWIEAPNVTAETYINRERAMVILDTLAFHLGYELRRKPTSPEVSDG